jgi:hypothetical protein
VGRRKVADCLTYMAIYIDASLSFEFWIENGSPGIRARHFHQAMPKKSSGGKELAPAEKKKEARRKRIRRGRENHARRREKLVGNEESGRKTIAETRKGWLT